MEMGPVSPARPVSGDVNVVDASTLRRLVIVAALCAFGLSATFVGFQLEERGVWPFPENVHSSKIVLD